MKNVAARFAEPYMARLEGKSANERTQEATKILQERGCMAERSWDGEDLLIAQHACQFPNVATRNSAVCALDVEFVRRLVGADARLTTSLLRGDDACTYRIRTAKPAARS